MYADGAVMYFSATDSQVIVDTLTNEFALVNKWLIDNNFFMHKGMLFVCYVCYLALAPG